MPALALDSFIRGNVYHDDKRELPASSRPSLSTHHRHSNTNGDRRLSQARSHSRGDGRREREKRRVQNSNSTKSKAHAVISKTPPAAYSESTQDALRPRKSGTSSRPSRPISVQPINTLPRLQRPVIIPQNPRDGGFCRAYTPLLEECQVSKTAFFYFLDDFDRSVEASPYFSAVNIASIGSLSKSHSTAMIVTLAKRRMNTFVDRVNEEFFQPRGLFCLIVTWRPDINKPHEEVNIEEPIYSSSTRSLPMPKAAQLSFPFGDPTENMEPTYDFPMFNNNMNGTGSVSPAFGRGAGIPRLAEASSNGFSNPYGNGAIGINQGIGMGTYNQSHGMGIGGARMTGHGGLNMGLGGTGMSGMGGIGGIEGGGTGGPLGLVADLNSDKNSSNTSQRSYQEAPNGYDLALMALDTKSNAKVFKKDAIYLMIVNMPSDDEMARFRASY